MLASEPSAGSEQRRRDRKVEVEQRRDEGILVGRESSGERVTRKGPKIPRSNGLSQFVAHMVLKLCAEQARA